MNRTRRPEAALGLLLLLSACSARTELIVGLTTDLVGGPDSLTTVHFTASHDGHVITDETWPVGPGGPQALPGSIGIYTDDGSEAHLVLELTGTLQSGATVKRDAIVDLAHGSTLFMRMMLAR